MFKFANKENTAVNMPNKGVFNITPGGQYWQEYQDWLAAGNVTEEYKTKKEQKEEAAGEKTVELDTAVQAISSSSFFYTVDDVQYEFFGDEQTRKYLLEIATIIIILDLSNSDPIPTVGGVWKTAGLAADGFTPITVAMDVKTFKEFCIAFFQKLAIIFDKKEKIQKEIKQKMKDDAATADDIATITIVL